MSKLMAELFRKSHNVSILMYHFVLVEKYRRLLISVEVDQLLKQFCAEISMKYEMRFLEMGKKGDHVHFLIQSIPSYSSTKIATKFKSISPEIYFLEFQEKTNQLWGREFWKDGYFVSIVGEHTKEIVIREYIKNQGKHC